MFELSKGVNLRGGKGDGGWGRGVGGGGKTMVLENECSSCPRPKLTSDLYKEVLGNVRGTAGKSSR